MEIFSYFFPNKLSLLDLNKIISFFLKMKKDERVFVCAVWSTGINDGVVNVASLVTFKAGFFIC